MKKLFRVNKTEVIMFDDQTLHTYKNVKIYFESGFKDNLYIRDVVFHQERRKISNIDLVIGEIPQWAFIIFPIFEDDRCT